MNRLFMGGGKYRALAVCFLAAAVGLSACSGFGTDKNDDDSSNTAVQIAVPVANPSGGEALTGTEIRLTTRTAGGLIYYNIGASPEATPDPTSANGTLYAGEFEITPPVTIKAIAVKDGMLPSTVLTASYTLKESVLPRVEKPVADPTPGYYEKYPENTPIRVTLSTPTDGADIYYIINGSAGDRPTTRDTKYEGPFEIMPTATVVAIVVKENFEDSNMLTVVYLSEKDEGTTEILPPALPTGQGKQLSDAIVSVKVYIEDDGMPDDVNFLLVTNNANSKRKADKTTNFNNWSVGYEDVGDEVRAAYRKASPFIGSKGESEAIAEIAVLSRNYFSTGGMLSPVADWVLNDKKDWWWANSRKGDDLTPTAEWRPESFNSKDNGTGVAKHPEGGFVDKALIYRRVDIKDTKYIAGITVFMAMNKSGGGDEGKDGLNERGVPTKLPEEKDGKWEWVYDQEDASKTPYDFNKGKDGDWIYMAVLKKDIVRR